MFLGILNHDVAWLLHAADRILAGERLYVDIVEINPPLILWLSLAPALVARRLGISPILAFRLMTLGVLAGSILLARWVLIREDPAHPAARRRVLSLAIVALLPLAGYEFGQREHLMLGLFIPYLLLASAQAEGRPMGTALPWVVGLVAGVGIALKPHFLLPWIAIEADLAWARRGWHARRRPEAIAVAAVGLAYGVAVAVLAPEYLAMMRWAMPLYARCNRASVAALLGEPATAIVAVAALAFLAIRPRGEHRERCRLLLIAALSLLAIAFVQDKGYPYHFYPAMAAAMILIGLLPPGWRDPGPRFSSLASKGILVALVLTTSAARIGDALLWRGNPGESDSTVGRMIRLSRGCARPGGVFTFSAAVAASFPLVNYGEVRWASRHPCLWFLTAFDPGEVQPGDDRAGREPGPMGDTERFLRDSVVSDLLTERPALLFVDEMEHKPAFHGHRFDFLAYYSVDPRFRDFLKDYERVSRVEIFGVYRRRDPNVASRGTRRNPARERTVMATESATDNGGTFCVAPRSVGAGL